LQNQTREGETSSPLQLKKIIMKTQLFFSKTLILLVALSSVLLYSCNNDKREAQRIAQQFLQLYYIDNDFNAVAELTTEASHQGLKHTAMLFEFSPESRLDNFETFKIISIDVQKTRAICSYEVDGVNRRLLLSKIDGRWFVDMPGDVTRQGAEFSLTLTPVNSGGFASAESEMTRIGDVPTKR